MLVLVLMVPFSMTYYTLLIIGDQSHVQEQTFTQNTTATIEVFLLLIHEWIYTDQFFTAVLWLDMDVKPKPGEEESFYRRRKSKIESNTCILNYCYYMVIFAWSVTSIAINDFAFRMTQFFFVLFQTLIFLYCLLRLRYIMHKVAKF